MTSRLDGAALVEVRCEKRVAIFVVWELRRGIEKREGRGEVGVHRRWDEGVVDAYSEARLG